MILFGVKTLLVLFLALIAAIVVAVKLRRSKRHPIYLLLSLVPFVVACGIILLMCRMPVRMYLQDFREVTGIDLPSDAQILYKSASIPPIDAHASIMLIKVSKQHHDALPDLLLNNGFVESAKDLPGWIQPMPEGYDSVQDAKAFSNEGGNINHNAWLMSDRSTIVILRQKY
jgi:hypothetical protein